MAERPRRFSIEYRPPQLAYAEFIRCNDLCFADEPMSEGEFERHRSGNFWAAYMDDQLIGFGIATDSEKTRRIKRMAICSSSGSRT